MTGIPSSRSVRLRELWPGALVAAAVAAVNVGSGLGKPSLFIDEAFSWSAASTGIGDLLHHVRADEVAPPTYYLGLHEWIYRVGSISETAMRLPSVIAAVALAVAVVWLAGLVASRRAALVAGLLAAISPLSLVYGQQVRAYIFAALFSTVAIAAAVTVQRRAGRQRRNWIAVGALAAAAALAFHYTALLTLVPLFWWCFRRSGWSRRSAGLFAAPAGIVALALVPLAGHQLNQGHEKGIAAAASFTAPHLIRVLAAPFDWRAETSNGWTLLGLVALVAAAVVLWRRRETLAAELRWLVVPAALVTPVVLVALTAAGSNSMISRYSVVSAPLVIVALAAAADLAAPRLQLVIVALAAAAALGNTLPSHSADGYYPDMRAAFRAMADGWQAGDRIALAGYPNIGPNAGYYAGRLLPPNTYPIGEGDRAALGRAVKQRSRLWLLSSNVASGPVLSGTAASVGYRLVRVTTLPARTPLQLVLMAPPPR
jgi:mannosyltransferase